MSKTMTTVRRQNTTFLEVCEEVLAAGYRVTFPAEGASMRPTVHHGDRLTVDRVDGSAIVAGDLVLYRRGDRAIAHRIAEIRSTEDGVAIVPRGDGKSACDAPIHPRQILGKVIAIERARTGAAARLAGFARALVVLACLTFALPVDAQVLSGSYVGNGVDN